MRGSASAFAALGLDQGADRVAVEQAYRRLMKQYHPDMLGGDAARAAEINRAYTELRTAAPLEDVQVYQVAPRRAPRPRRQRSRKLWIGAIAACGAAVMLQGDRDVARWSDWTVERWSGLFPPQQAVGPVPEPASLEAPLSAAPISAATREALRLSLEGEPELLAMRSRNCHSQYRAQPQVAQLDRCIAFDTAASAILHRDPMQDSGPFGASAVTARALTAAGLVSTDYLAIERRLRLIRTQVEIALLAPAAPAPEAPRLSLAEDGDRAVEPY